uniref:Uncharacterized protein n=1 Tax=Romanomermis culicivorax TaxID=13658 RepID=A0A915IFK1_ROMCU
MIPFERSTLFNFFSLYDFGTPTTYTSPSIFLVSNTSGMAVIRSSNVSKSNELYGIPHVEPVTIIEGL